MTTPKHILDFWFNLPPQAWFKKDSQFDADLRQNYGELVDAALAGGLQAWEASADGCLALILLCDQFTRNVHRDLPQAFAGDPRALALAQHLVASGGHLQLSPIQRVFAYLPFEHAEDLAMQAQSIALFSTLVAEQPAMAQFLDYAERHQAVIVRFGRFPHRNAVLGRVSTEDEQAYLTQPGSGF